MSLSWVPVGLAATAAHKRAATHPGIAGLCIKDGTSYSSPTVGKICGVGKAAQACGGAERDS